MTNEKNENRKEKVIRQVLDVTGEIDNLHEIKASNVFGNNWRLDIWCWYLHPNTLESTRAYRIDYSYFITIDETGAILESTPELGKKSTIGSVKRKLPTRSRL